MNPSQNSFFAAFSICVTILGSLSFGFQTAVISGALPFLSKDFSLMPGKEGVVVSAILLGAVAGVLSSGMIADRFGRRPAMMLSSFLFIIGSFEAATSMGVVEFILGRFLSGLALGLISMVAPLYLAEISPTKARGMIVSIHQLTITLGVLCAYLVNYHFAKISDWRSMFFIGLIPSSLQFLGLFFIKESASWLSINHQKLSSKASEISGKAKGSFKGVFLNPKVRFVVILGVALNMFQQITGINVVIYYTPIIFENTGFQSVNLSILATIGIGVINVLSTFFSIWLVDKAGRRTLLMLSLSGMFISLISLSSLLFFQSRFIEIGSLLSLMGFVASFAFGLGPVTIVVVSEIYPLKIRGRAMSIATTANWFFNYLTSLVFLDLMAFFGLAGVFSMFSLIILIAFFFVYFYIPETKGKSLEEIEKSL